MFHDELLSSKIRPESYEAYGKMADTVSASLTSYLWALGHVHEAFRQSGEDYYVSPTLLMMECAEHIDGISILARTGSSTPCTPLNRTAFEIRLALMYMLEMPETEKDRCLAYEYFHHLKQLKTLLKCDPDTVEGKQVRGQTKDSLLPDAFDHPDRDIAEETKAYRELLDTPRYSAIKSEQESSKAKHWHEMWGGPGNVEALARCLKRSGHYEVFYRGWSGPAHGEAALYRLSAGELQAEMDPVRYPRGLPMQCINACNTVNELSLFLLDRFAPSARPELSERYRNNIKPGFDYTLSVKGMEG